MARTAPSVTRSPPRLELIAEFLSERALCRGRKACGIPPCACCARRRQAAIVSSALGFALAVARVPLVITLTAPSRWFRAALAARARFAANMAPTLPGAPPPPADAPPGRGLG